MIMLPRTMRNGWKRLVAMQATLPTGRTISGVRLERGGCQPARLHLNAFSSVCPVGDEQTDEEQMNQVRVSLLQQSHIRGIQLENAVACIQWWARHAVTAEDSETGQSMLQHATDLFHHVNQQTYDMTWRRGMYPKAPVAYNSLLSAWVALGGTPPPNAMFSRLKDINDFPLDNETYGLVMDGAIKTMSGERLPLFCEDVLRYMMDFPSKGIGKSKWPNADTFTRCYKAWEKSGHADASGRAFSLFDVQKKSAKPGAPAIDEDSLTALLRVLLRGGAGMKERYYHLLRADEACQYAKEKRISLTATHYEIMIGGWLDYFSFGRNTNHTMMDAIEAANKLWESLRDEHGSSECDRDRAVVSRMLNRMVRVILNNRPTLPEIRRAEELLGKFSSDSPSQEILSATVTAYANTYHLQDAARVVGVIERSVAEPDWVAYGALVNAWWKRGIEAAKRGPENDILHAAVKAELFFLRVLRLYENRHPVTAFPCRLLASRVIDLWAKGRDLDKVGSILAHVRRFHQSTGVSFAKPNTELLTQVLRAYATQSLLSGAGGNAAEKATDLLLQMHEKSFNGDADIRPSNECYMLVVRAWARSTRSDRIPRCVEVFDRLRVAHKNKILGVQPDCPAYLEMFKVFSREGDSTGSIRLLKQMLEDNADGNKLAKPDIMTFNMVLLACLRSKETVVAAKQALLVYEILRSNECRFGVRPNTNTHSLMAEALTRVGTFPLESKFFTSMLHKERQCNLLRTPSTKKYVDHSQPIER